MHLDRGNRDTQTPSTTFAPTEFLVYVLLQHLEEDAVSNADLAIVYAYALTIANISAKYTHGGDSSEYALASTISITLLANASQELELACYHYKQRG